jgi:hypothetical protein
MNDEALAVKGKRRKSSDCALKANSLTRGDLASRLKGRRHQTEREVSRGHSSGVSREGPNVKESNKTMNVEGDMRQMSAKELLPELMGETPKGRQSDESPTGNNEPGAQEERNFRNRRLRVCSFWGA